VDTVGLIQTSTTRKRTFGNGPSIGLTSIFFVAEVVASILLAVPGKSKRRVQVPKASVAVVQFQTRNRIFAVPVFDAVIVVSNSQDPLWIVIPPRSVE
jgi:hypothetical protein